jgi:hypothetical protein
MVMPHSHTSCTDPTIYSAEKGAEGAICIVGMMSVGVMLMTRRGMFVESRDCFAKFSRVSAFEIPSK